MSGENGNTKLLMSGVEGRYELDQFLFDRGFDGARTWTCQSATRVHVPPSCQILFCFHV